MTLASYSTPMRALTPNDIVGGTLQPPVAAFAVTWTPGDEQDALKEATRAFDQVVADVMAAILKRNTSV